MIKLITNDKMAAVSKVTQKELPAKWKVREQLILASAVQRSGDQNWVSVSRCMRPFAEESRPPEFYSQKSCATQYSVLLDKTATPRRKRKEAGTSNPQESDTTIETVEEQIVRHLTSKRIKELDRSLAKMKEDYMSLKKEIEMIERGDLDNQLVSLLRESKSPETPLKKKSQSPPATTSAPPVATEPPEGSIKDKPHPLKVNANASPLKDTVKTIQVKGEEETTPSEPLVDKTVPLEKIQIAPVTEERFPNSVNVSETALMQGPSSDSVNEEKVLEPKHSVSEAMEAETAAESTQEEGKLELLPVNRSPVKEEESPKLMSKDLFEIERAAGPVVEKSPSPDQKVEVPKSATEALEVCSTTENEKVPGPLVVEGLSVKDPGTLASGETKPVSQEEIKQEPTESVETEVASTEDKEGKRVTTLNKEDDQLMDDESSEGNTFKEKEEEPDKEKEIVATPPKDENKTIPQNKPLLEEEKGSCSPEKEHVIAVTTPTIESKRKTEEKKESETKDEERKMESHHQQEQHQQQQQDREEEEEKPVRKSKRKKPSTNSQVKVVVEDEKVTESETEEEYKDETEEDEDYYEEAPSPKPVTRRTRARRGTKRRDRSWDSRESPLLKSSKSSDKGRRSVRLEEKEEGSPAPPSGKKGKNTRTPPGRKRPGNRRLKTEFQDSPKPEEESDEEPLSSAIPSPATSQGDNESETPQTLRTWKKTIMLVWRHAAQHKYANLFLHPVKDEDAPGYHEVILRPMDLSTIKKNIETGVIHTDIEFQRDIMLMFQNALMYNSSDHDVYKMAEEMRTDVLENIQEYQMTQLMVQSTSTAKALRSRDSKKTEGFSEEKGKRTPVGSEDTPKKTRSKPRPDD